LRVVGAKRIRADKFGELRGFMDSRCASRTHFMQHRRHAAARYLPSGFATRKAAADDMNWP
jgi:hypothetical protein